MRGRDVREPLSRAALVVVLACAAFGLYAAEPAALQIYFIDVEGGQATLIVTPARQTLLVDAGTLAAFRPRAAIVNNAARKGGQRETLRAVREAQGVDLWQLHRSESGGDDNAPPERIANLDEQAAHWLKVEARPDGSFRVLNARTARWTDYRPR